MRKAALKEKLDAPRLQTTGVPVPKAADVHERNQQLITACPGRTNDD